MSQVANTTTNPVRRRSQRVLMQVGVRIRGTDTANKPFEEETETLAINAHGALVSLKNRITSGSKVKLKHKMTEEEQERALQPFGQAKPATTRNYGGTGLGLPITKGLVEAHGGELTIKSQAGYGTIVRVALPTERKAVKPGA